MNMKLNENPLQKKMRWSALLLLAGFLLGSLLPTGGRGVQAAPQKATALDVVISEVAWMGTIASANDEWIELHNTTSNPIDLSGWSLKVDNGSQNPPNISLGGTIPAQGYFLLERSDNSTVNDIAADLIYTGALGNDKVTLYLYDNSGSGTPIDTANLSGGIWPAGDNDDKTTMERISYTTENDSVWKTNDGVNRNGLDADLNPINGTPRNSGRKLIINEVAWAGTLASADDQWIELYSPNGGNFPLTDWKLIIERGDEDIEISLNGETSSDGYFLLEFTHAETVTDVAGFDGGSHNQIYPNGKHLNLDGELLRLVDQNEVGVDTANSEGHDSSPNLWPAGLDSSATSMERNDITLDLDLSWVTWGTTSGMFKNGKDASENNINGSPGYPKDTEPTPIPSATYTPSITFTPTITNTPTITPTAIPALTILINEVAWMGTGKDGLASDEWIELYNPGTLPVHFDDGNGNVWHLVSEDEKLDIALSGTIQPGEYFLLERQDDDTVSDITADQIYPTTDTTLSNSGEVLGLLAPNSSASSGFVVVDTANINNSSWVAGRGSPDYASMERKGTTADSSSAWFTYAGAPDGIGLDANGDEINGTPKQANWAFSVTATAQPTHTKTPIPPTKTPTPFPYQSVVLNEVLARPAHDWNGDGTVNVYDEFIEIINRGNTDVNLQGWKLDDEYNQGSPIYVLPNTILPAGERIVIFGDASGISLSDGGDSVRLLKSNNQIADVITYTIIKNSDESWCRYPENSSWQEHCFPTPSKENALYGSFDDSLIIPAYLMCLVPDTVPTFISSIECGDLGMHINNPTFWNSEAWVKILTGHAKHVTWVR